MELKQGQYYQLPDGTWSEAMLRSDGYWVLLLLGDRSHIPGDDAGYNVRDALVVQHNGVLEATRRVTWEYWTVRDMREATPDEAETQHYRKLRLIR